MKQKFILALLIVMLFAMVGQGMAQEIMPELTLRLNRDFGFGGFGKIQGRFTLKTDGPENLTRVEFFIDGNLMGVVEQSPFEYHFHTDDYSAGRHVFLAVGYTSEVSSLESNLVSTVILSSEDAWSETQQMIVPLLVMVGIFTLIGLGAPLLFRRKKAFQIGDYGPAGGAVCPRCKLPYSRKLLAPNLLVGKLGNCPHCGKWSIVPRASRTSLKEAEARYQSEKPQALDIFPSEEGLDRLLDESRFEE